MSRSQDEREFGASTEPEISDDHLERVGTDCELTPEFLYEDVCVNGGSFAEADAGSGRVVHARIGDVDLRESKLRAVRFVDVEGISLDASNADWRGAHLRRVLVSNSRLTGLTLSEAKLEEVIFRNCKLDYANLRFAELVRVSFEDCALTDADFQGASCSLSRFYGCDMRGTDFSKAKLDGTDLRGSELRLSGGTEALNGAIVSTAQAIDLVVPLAEAAGIVVTDD